MATAIIMDFDDATLDHYDAITEEMDLHGHAPDGCLWHYAGEMAGRLRVIDCWEDRATFERFAEGTLGPLGGKHGLGMPRMEMFDVQQAFNGEHRDAQFLQVVRLPGLDRAAFEAMDAKIRADGRVPDALVHHVNGAYDGGAIVVDTWTSKDERDRFMEANIRPNVQDAPLSGPPIIEEMAVHGQLVAATART